MTVFVYVDTRGQPSTLEALITTERDQTNGPEASPVTGPVFYSEAVYFLDSSPVYIESISSWPARAVKFRAMFVSRAARLCETPGSLALAL